jgi:hypothetical protein
MKTIDFPAGHSMDTDWFAVDKDGNIGLFDSCAEGVVPIRCPEYWRGFLRECTEEITPGLKRLYLSEKLIEEILKHSKMEAIEIYGDHIESVKTNNCVIMLAKDKTWEDLGFEEYFANPQDEEDFAVSLSPDIPLFWIDTWETNIMDRFIEAVEKGVIAAVGDIDRWIENENLDEVLVYRYTNGWGGCATPYSRERAPQIPLNISQLSEEAKAKIPRFDVSFKDAPIVQALAYVPVKTWRDIDTRDYPTEKIDGAHYSLLQISETEEAWCLIDDMVNILPSSYTEEEQEKHNALLQKTLEEADKRPRMLKCHYAVSPELYNELQALKDFVQFIYDDMSEEWKSNEENVQKTKEIIRLIETIDRHHNKRWLIRYRVSIKHPNDTFKAYTWEVSFDEKKMRLYIYCYYFGWKGDHYLSQDRTSTNFHFCFDDISKQKSEGVGSLSDFIANVLQYKSHIPATSSLSKQLTIEI